MSAINEQLANTNRHIAEAYKRLSDDLVKLREQPKGWRVCWVRLARPTCPDAHWFLLLKKI